MLRIKLFTFSPVQENTYVIYDDQGWCAIIDPGCYFDFEKNDLHSYLLRENLQPKYLLNTHCHLDHVFGNKFIADSYNLPLYLHPQEKILLDFAPASGQQWGLPFDGYMGSCVYINEGDNIMIGNDRLDVILAPGHSPGSICFYCEAQSFIISGDVLFRESIGRTDLPGGNYDTLIQSIQQKLFVLPDEVKVYPGHGPVTSIGYEKEHNPFLHHAGR